MPEEGGGVLIHLDDVGGATALPIAPGMGAVPSPMACLMAVEVEVVAIRLALVVRTSGLVRQRSAAASSSAVALAARLVLLAAAGMPTSVLGRPGRFLLLHVEKARHCSAVYKSLSLALIESKSSACS